MLTNSGNVYGWPQGGYPAPQGPFYCGVGSTSVYGRPLAEAHMVSGGGRGRGRGREGGGPWRAVAFVSSLVSFSLADRRCLVRTPKPQNTGKNRNNKQDACIKAGLIISGINAEVMPGQWEFQIGPVGPLEVGDQVIFSPAFPFFPRLFLTFRKMEKNLTFSPFFSPPQNLSSPPLSPPQNLSLPRHPPKNKKTKKTKKRS